MKTKRALLALLMDSDRHVAARRWVKSVGDALKWAEAVTGDYGYEVAVYTINEDKPIFHRAFETVWGWQKQEV